MEGGEPSYAYETSKTFLSEAEKEVKRDLAAKLRGEYQEKVSHAQFVWRNNLVNLIEVVMSSVGSAERCRADFEWLMERFPKSKDAVVYRLIQRKRFVRGLPIVDVLLERTEKKTGGPKKSIAAVLTGENRRARLALTRLLGKEEGLHAWQLFEELRGIQRLWLACATFNPCCEFIKQKGDSAVCAWLAHITRVLPVVADRLGAAGADYEMLNAALLEHIFEFNQYQQPVRYRSIILRHEMKRVDEMGLPKPEFYIVVYLNRRTGQRRTVDLRRYKTALRDKARGGAPASRECTGLITGPIMKHCYLGRRKSDLLSMQKRLLELIERWEPLRTQLLDCIRESRSK